MTITAAVLVWARVENLERLARALRMPLPPRRLYADPRRYRIRLARMIAANLAAHRDALTLAGAPC